MINDFAKVIIQQNNPHLCRSMYAKWIPIAWYELYHFLALFVAIGLNKRPYLKDYWSQNDIYYRPWYHKIMLSERYEPYHVECRWYR